MPTYPFTGMQTRIRKMPLGPVAMNQLNANIEALDGLYRVEHAVDGQHNAPEIPWILGHVADGGTPTGYLFDTAFGGGTLARPATGRYTISAVSGVISQNLSGENLYVPLANVSGTAIESKPHTITTDFVSDTSLVVRTSVLSSPLGAGNTWADTNVNFDYAAHALAQDPAAPNLLPFTPKQRRDFLTDGADDWNSMVRNQGTLRKAALLEHTSAGEHNVNRIAKAVVWCEPVAGPDMEILHSEGVAGITRDSLGITTLTMSDTYAAQTGMACFPEAIPTDANELVIINGRAHSTTQFRFCTYVYSGGNWARADRSFFAAMFGAL